MFAISTGERRISEPSTVSGSGVEAAQRPGTSDQGAGWCWTKNAWGNYIYNPKDPWDWYIYLLIYHKTQPNVVSDYGKPFNYNKLLSPIFLWVMLTNFVPQQKNNGCR